MADHLPYPLPGPFDPSGPYNNPGQTVPRPSPSSLPVGCWMGPRVSMAAWTANPTTGVLWRTEWATPIFDMRPDLGALSNNRAGAHTSAIPIWRAGGQNVATQMFVQVYGITDFRGFQVVSIEEAHVQDLTQILSVTGPQDITADFTSKGTSSLSTFSPPGDGYPVRYWRLRVQFQYLSQLDAPVNAGDLPAIVLQAAMY